MSEFPKFYEEREKNLFGRGTVLVRKTERHKSPGKLPAISAGTTTMAKQAKWKTSGDPNPKATEKQSTEMLVHLTKNKELLEE